MKRMMALLFALTVGGGAQANLITHNGYTLDTNTNIVTGGGLEWLQWDETVSTSWNDVTDTNSSYFLDGWQVASQSQMAGLFNHWGFGGITWDSNEDTRQEALLDRNDPQVSALAADFTELFGLTYQNKDGYGDDRFWSRAFFGNDLDQDGGVNWAQIYSPTQNTDGFAIVNRDSAYKHSVGTSLGVALVRSTETVSVPEPSTLALLGLGLIGFTLRRRKAN